MCHFTKIFSRFCFVDHQESKTKLPFWTI